MELLQVSIVGLFATCLTDLWQQLLKRGFGMPTANWRLIGRWVAGIPGGIFVRRPITDASPIRGEAAVGWVFHYFIGIVYAGIYLAIIRVWPQAGPSLASALLFAVVTLVAPWFVMQPALGFGVMARHLPHRQTVLAVTVTTHLVFGAGLYLGMSAWESDWRF